MPSRRRLIRLLLSVLLAAIVAAVGVDVASNPVPAPSATTQETVTLERVVDGDTIWVSGHRKVRLIGINAPEVGSPAQPYGAEASRHLEGLLGSQPLTLEKDVSQTDKYGRLLRYIYVNGENVSVRMVRDGYATSSSYPPDVKHQDEIRAAEREARENRGGLWQ